ncbi:MAG: suppressor of fused domain protein [Crocinitomicaceae bacterium]|nr:suppressor of fused domain protein [Crocinitomicaceae bacterium]
MQAFLQKNKETYQSEKVLSCGEYDIITVMSDKFDDCKLLFTRGISKIDQKVDDGHEAYINIELFFCLPEYWNLEKMPWPIEWLQKMGDYVVKQKSWFGHGHTIPLSTPLEMADGKFKAEAFFLMRPDYLANQLGDDFVSESGFVPLAIVPIFKQELDLKIRTSHNLLLKRFEKKAVDERIDIYRKSSCRKKVWGIF